MINQKRGLLALHIIKVTQSGQNRQKIGDFTLASLYDHMM